MKYTIYNSATGQIQMTISGDTQEWMNQNLQGKTFVEGDYAGDKFYIVNGQVLAMPSNPSNGHQIYDFNYETKSWQINLEKSEQAIRKIRDKDLASVDKINPMWYASMTTQQQQDLQTFRKALLDVPQQSGFPESVTWPTKPDWL